MTGADDKPRKSGGITSVGPSSTSACSNPAATTITTQDEASELDNQCERYYGDIEFADYGDPTIIMDKLFTISGNLTISNNPSIVSIKFTDLNSVNGTLHLGGLNSATDISFPQLNSIGTLDVSNSMLEVLNGFNPLLEEVTRVSITDNANLTSISLPMRTVGELEISTNSWPNVSLPNLKIANSISVSNIHTFDASLLENITGDANFTNTTVVDLALNALTSVGSIDIANPWSMSGLYLENLTTVGKSPQIGDFIIEGSRYLTNLSLPALQEVTGEMKLAGNFSDINFPQLTSVSMISVTTKGTANESVFDCTGFLNKTEHQIQEDSQIDCNNQTIHRTTTTSPTATATNSAGSTTSPISSHHKSSSGLSTGAKAGIGVGAAIAALALLAILATFILRSRRKQKPLSDLSRDQSKQLDYSPMIGAPTEQPQYHDALPTPVPSPRANRDYGEIQTGDSADRGLGVEEEGDRAVSPVSMDERQSGGRGSFGSRSVSPVSVDRVPLGSGSGRE